MSLLTQSCLLLRIILFYALVPRGGVYAQRAYAFQHKGASEMIFAKEDDAGACLDDDAIFLILCRAA